MSRTTRLVVGAAITVSGPVLDGTVLAHTPAHEFDRTDITSWIATQADRMIGWQFTLSSTIEVTALGVYDRPYPSPEPGLSTPREIGLWSSDMMLLASAVVPEGNGGELCEDDFRYVEIAPLVLRGGASYVVAALWPDVPFDHLPALIPSDIEPVYHPSIGSVQTRFHMGAAFVFPTESASGNEGVGAVNFRIGDNSCMVLEPPTFTTLFASDNHFAGNMFDLRATDPGGLVVTGWQVNIGDPLPQETPVNVTIYWRTGSYVGATNSQEGWNELGSATVLSRGQNRGTPVPVGGLELPYDQTIGVYVLLTDYIDDFPPPTVPAMYYTNIPGAPSTFDDGSLVLTGGVAKGVPPFTGDTYANRMWNGGIDYLDSNPADINDDGVVNVEDLSAVILAWGPCSPGPCPADTNGDGVVNVADLTAVILAWS